MRDVLILLVFGVGILYALKHPFVGVLVFMWISVMNPHRYGWGFVYYLPLAQVAAIITFVSLALHSDQIRFPKTRESFLFLCLWGWITNSTLFAFYPDDARAVWQLVTKIFLMTVVSMVLMTSRQRVTVFLLALTGFVGFLGVKGAIFGILTGGEFKVWGPPESFLEGENAAALAMVMMIPFCFLLRPTIKNKWLSRSLLFVGFSFVISTALTYSRGGLIGLVLVCSACAAYSRRRFVIFAMSAVIAIVGLSVVPSKWKDRMSTIKTYEQDNSANMRLNSWALAVNLAKDHPIVGGGFDCYTMEQYYRYSPNPDAGKMSTGEASTAHSIYFEVLAMHGFVGLAIFMSCLLSILASMFSIQRRAARAGHTDTAAFARAILVSVLGFMASGAFLSRAFFDLFWAIFVAGICFKSLVSSNQWHEAPEPESAAKSRDLKPAFDSPRPLVALKPGTPD